MTIDDLLRLLGEKEAHIAQLQRHIRLLDQRPVPAPAQFPIVELVAADPNGSAPE